MTGTAGDTTTVRPTAPVAETGTRVRPTGGGRLYVTSCRVTSMDIDAFFGDMPFADLVGIEVIEAADGHAEGRLPTRRELSWRRDRSWVHGGATFTLADVVGGAALMSVVDRPVPTIDMRIDYLEADSGDLHAAADVVRLGTDVGTVDVTVTDRAGTALATVRGVYKTGGGD